MAKKKKIRRKAKTKKVVKKRFKITKTGKILYRGQMIRHLRSRKRKSRIRRQKRLKEINGKSKRVIRKLLPYG